MSYSVPPSVLSEFFGLAWGHATSAQLAAKLKPYVGSYADAEQLWKSWIEVPLRTIKIGLSPWKDEGFGLEVSVNF